MGPNIFDTKVFCAGVDRREAVAGRGPLGNRVLIIEDKQAPFPESSFDSIVTNSMLEHGEDPDTLLADTHRFLPVGRYLTLYPTRDSWREGATAYHSLVSEGSPAQPAVWESA